MAFDRVHGPLAVWAAHQPQRLALSDGVSHYSFETLWQAVQARAAALDAAGQPPGAALLIPDDWSQCAQLCEFLAVIAGGRCAALGDPGWPVSQRAAAAQALQRLPDSPEALFYVGFTSGSTGRPKGFARSHASWIASFEACNQAFGEKARQAFFVPGRLAHSLFLFGMLHALWNGATCVIQEKFSPGAALRRLAEGDLSAMVAVPSQLLLMLDYARQHHLAPLPAVGLLLIGGAQWPRQHTEALQGLFPNADLRVFYGASELSFVAWAAADAAAPVACVGRPFDGVSVTLRPLPGAPAAGNGLAPGTPGQIWVRSAMAFAGYVGDSQADGSACQRDGDWLSVRDIGAIDAHGCLHLLGRLDRMLTVHAKKLFPEEVERVLESCPGVVRASVQAVPDALRGARVVAALALDPEGVVTPQAVHRWCLQHLQRYKVPRRFYAAAEWRWTASGKTDHAAMATAIHSEALWLTRWQ